MGRTVLVADDDLVTQKILRMTLTYAGYEVTAVCDGEEILRVLETSVPDAVVLDVVIPKLDGFSVLRRIRDDPRTSQVPVVLLTARASPGDLWRGWQEGVDHYLTKPLDCEELLRFMDRTVPTGDARHAAAQPTEPVAASGQSAAPATCEVEPTDSAADCVGPNRVEASTPDAGRAEPVEPAEPAVDSPGPAVDSPGPAVDLPEPAVDSPGPAVDLPEPAAATVSASVLVVDDDPFVQKILRLNLELEGYAVDSASNGEEALKRLARARPDIVILDVMMPVLDGLEALRRIREDPATADLPVILLTARSSEEDMWEGWQRGVDYYLTKPFDIEDLLRSMRRLLSGRQTAQR